jgi:hypothetical protein
VVSRRIAELHVPVRITLDMVGTMSAARSVGFVGDDELARQRLIEIGEGTSFWDVLSELEHNRRSAIPQRMKAFTDLQDRIGPTPNATSLREEPVVVM